MGEFRPVSQPQQVEIEEHRVEVIHDGESKESHGEQVAPHIAVERPQAMHESAVWISRRNVLYCRARN